MKKGAFIHAWRGFTLVELMVVVALVAILVAMAAPAYRTVVARSAVTGISHDVQMALQRARAEAVSRNTCVSVCRASGGVSADDSADWASGWLVFINETCDAAVSVPASSDRLLVREPINPRVSLTVKNANNKASPHGVVMFNNRGVLFNFGMAGTFVVADASGAMVRSRQVVLSGLGRVRAGDHDVP